MLSVRASCSASEVSRGILNLAENMEAFAGCAGGGEGVVLRDKGDFAANVNVCRVDEGLVKTDLGLDGEFGIGRRAAAENVEQHGLARTRRAFHCGGEK